jgi:hypothetical protein
LPRRAPTPRSSPAGGLYLETELGELLTLAHDDLLTGLNLPLDLNPIALGEARLDRHSLNHRHLRLWVRYGQHHLRRRSAQHKGVFRNERSDSFAADRQSHFGQHSRL